MIRIILSSLAVVALLATSATPAASQAKMTGQPGSPTGGTIIGSDFNWKALKGSEFNWKAFKKSTLERHLASGGSQSALPPTDCPPAPTQQCLDSWKVKTANPFE